MSTRVDERQVAQDRAEFIEKIFRIVADRRASHGVIREALRVCFEMGVTEGRMRAVTDIMGGLKEEGGAEVQPASAANIVRLAVTNALERATKTDP